MKVLIKILKWLVKTVGLLLILILLAGLFFRLFNSPPEPEGNLVDVNGIKLYVKSAGKKDSLPTVVVEGGAGLVTGFYYWLEQGLKDSLRVVRYDRAGIGFSDELSTPRDPETVAHELHSLLEKSGESPPYILVGHSLGGPYIRVYAQLYPNEVEALFFIDATHHDHVERYNAPQKSSTRYKMAMKSLRIQSIAADMGLLALYDHLFKYPYSGDGLPDEVNTEIKSFLFNGKTSRGFHREMEYFYEALAKSAEARDFVDMPIRSFTAIAEPIDTATSINDDATVKSSYVEFEDLSTNGQHYGIVANHGTIVTKKENAYKICQEIIEVSREVISSNSNNK